MKIIYKHAMNKWEFRYGVVVEVDGKPEAEFYDGEPEDNSIGRNFNDIHNIPKLMKMAYEAGVKGEDFSVSEEEVTWDELF